MEEMVTWLADAIKWIVAIGSALTAIRMWVIKPIDAIKKEQETINNELKCAIAKNTETLEKINADLLTVQNDVADTLGDRLTQAHRYFMARGWCTASEKKFICDLHSRYKARGHNHLADTYEDDIMNLPDLPPQQSN